MKLHHSFDLPGPVDHAWELLNRIDVIATCLPGASAAKTSDGKFAGNIRMRVGPLDMTFKGGIEIVEQDRALGRMLLRSKANEARGQGTASAKTVAMLSRNGDLAHVELETDLAISGRVAQMGRGMIDEVSNDLLDRFVTNLKKQHLRQTDPLSNGSPHGEEHHEEMPSSVVMDASKAESQLNLGALLWRIFKRRALSFFTPTRSR